MIRSVLSVFAGYAAIVVIVMSGLALVSYLGFGTLPAGAGKPYAGPIWFLYAELALGAVAAIAGGWLTGYLGQEDALRHGAYLAAFMLVMSGVSAYAEAGLKPLWSSLALPVVGIAGVMAGAWLRSRGLPI